MKTKKIWLIGIMCLYFAANAVSQTGVIKGLTVVVEFPDAPFVESDDSVSLMMNQPNFSGWGNQGSVRDFFLTQSNGKLDLSTNVIRVSMPNPVSYYYGGPGNNTDIQTIAGLIRQKYPNGFSNLTLLPDGSIQHVNIVCKADVSAWAFMQQPGNTTIKVNGQFAPIRNGNICSYKRNQHPLHNVICHETGHSLLGFTDFYRTAHSNLGMFDVMASAGSDQRPMPFGPALRFQKRWIDNITNIDGSLTADYSIEANSYSRMYRYVNPMNDAEYLIFYYYKHGDYYQSVIDGSPTPEGLAIWYVDEQSGYIMPGQDTQYLIKLVQADNMDQMHDEDAIGHVRGDLNDLYGNGNNSFPNGHPWRWKDGGEFGINISNITKSGNYVTFTVNGRTRTVLAMSDLHGTLSPKGVINVANGTSQSFTFTPDPGYELADILVDEMSVPISNPYTLTGIGTTPKTIQPLFLKKANIPALPSPWQKAQIGTTGLAAHNTGSFGLEAEGGYMNAGNDKFTYVYQTINGNGTIIARVASWNKPNENHRAGIMIRESLQENSVQTMLVKAAFGGHRAEQRTATGNDLHGSINMHIYNLYNWLKITREGNVFTTYCSKDGIRWNALTQETISMPNQVMFGLCVAGGAQYFPAKASFDNVSITNTAQNGCTLSGTKITGTTIGTAGSWQNAGATRDKAFDGLIFTDFDAPTGDAWTGLSLGNSYRVTGIKYFPRKQSMGRMVGGKFQGSNTADFSSGVVDLATITTEPPYDWNCIQVTNTSSFAYIRYLGPSESHGNVGEIEFYGNVQAVNQLPSVVITSPVNGNSFTSPGNITINANASDADGSIVKVEFYIGSSYYNRDTDAPYTTTISNLSTGIYEFKAIAYDNLGATSEFTVSNITVGTNAAPVVNITSPVTNQKFTAPTNITINTNVSDAEGNVWKVEFYNGSTFLGSDFTEPYSYTWNDVPVGNYTIRAKAIDNLGAFSESVSNNIAVVANTAPQINITSLETNQSFAAPATITINTDVYDAEGNISVVEFYYGTTLLGTDVTAPYSYTWNNVPAGVYNITAQAKDSQNAIGTSTRNNIAVIANQAPTVSITSPASNAGFAAPANITINANAADADGSIWKVEFYNGNTFLNTDFTAPYSYTWSNVAAGTYSITARAIDNTGAYTEHTVSNISVTNSTADITGPACATNNATLTYVLAPSKRVGATNYGWYFTGSTQSFIPSGYQTTLVTGSNYGAGQVCVGVGYNAAPWHTTYCITVPKCSGARMDESESEWVEMPSANTVSFPNPFDNEVTLTLPSDNETATIEVFNANGNKVHNALTIGSYTFGNELGAGIYFVKIITLSKTETIKVVKK